MNRFEQFIGKKIIKVFRIHRKEDNDFDFLLALFLQLDEYSGLRIGTGLNHELTTVRYMTLDDIREEFGTQYYETKLNGLKTNDQLNGLIGKTIQSIKVGLGGSSKYLSPNKTIPGAFNKLIIRYVNLKY